MTNTDIACCLADSVAAVLGAAIPDRHRTDSRDYWTASFKLGSSYYTVAVYDTGRVSLSTTSLVKNHDYCDLYRSLELADPDLVDKLVAMVREHQGQLAKW